MVDVIGINFLILKKLYFNVGLNAVLLVDTNVRFSLSLRNPSPARKGLLAIYFVSQRIH